MTVRCLLKSASLRRFFVACDHGLDVQLRALIDCRRLYVAAFVHSLLFGLAMTCRPATYAAMTCHPPSYVAASRARYCDDLTDVEGCLIVVSCLNEKHFAARLAERLRVLTLVTRQYAVNLALCSFCASQSFVRLNWFLVNWQQSSSRDSNPLN